MIEGRNYHFRVIKTVSMHGTGQEYIVLEDPFRNRHLIPADQYENYNLNPGKRIICHIDRINCDGKIFIEPKHPCYETGKTYDFEFVRKETRINQIGESEEVAIVKDLLGNERIAPMSEQDKKLKKTMNIRCKVIAIRKGKIHLSLINRGRVAENLVVGESYDFLVKKVARGVDDRDYFVLEDPFGQIHLLRQSYYNHYRITVGEKINGTVVKFGSDGQYLIEPEHPHYRIGRKYSFSVETVVKEKNPDNGYSNYLIVRDARGEANRIPFNNLPVQDTPLPVTISCKIEDVRKGKLILSVDESSFL